jgi:diguanylate cyclase (GGDEF)-like protein
MAIAPLPINENVRLAVLRDYNVLDTPPNPQTDAFVRLAADLFEVPIALLSLIDENRQWFKAALGVDATEISRNVSFCAHAILVPSEVMVVEDATCDARFFDNPLVTGEPEVRFYAGVSILSPDGHPLGTLCVIDRKPRELNLVGRRRLDDLAMCAAAVLTLHRSVARLQHAVTHDPLTGLANRASFDSHWKGAVQRATEHGVRCAVLCIDIDDFDTTKNRLGQVAGNAILRAVADLLQGAIRATDMAARMGGDEFAVLLVGVSESQVVRQMASRIIDAIGAPLEVGSMSVSIRTSVGFAIVPDDGLNSGILMNIAAAAAYRVKTTGHGVSAWHHDPLNIAGAYDDAIRIDLQRAIEAKSFTLHWQPHFDLQTGRARGQEALIRWNRPHYGPTSPDIFIPIAEKAGLIGQIDAWVLETACHEAVSWPGQQNVSVNISPSTFCSKDFISQLAYVLENSELTPDRLVIEITERTALDHYATSEYFNAVHKLGVRVALDDFGSGYATIGNIQKFAFDKLKLDRSLVKNISGSTRSRVALAGIICLARSVGMLVCAEGIETNEQLAVLTEISCNLGQGFLLARPSPQAEFGVIPWR